MDKEKSPDVESLNDNEWTFLLLMMFIEDAKQKNAQWQSFEDELIYKKRFSVKHPVIDEIHECQENAETIRRKDTILYEVRPIIGDTVSVAKFKLQKDVRLYDLTIDIYDIENDEVVDFPRLYNTIGAMFSRPYNGDASKYLPTQYIAEEIKNMGFDGLRFRSSLNKNGYNIVLYNPDNCIAISSDLVEIKGIDLKMDKPMIYKVGTPKLKEEMGGLNWIK